MGTQGHYLQDYTLKSWLLTTDHKRIGLMYMAAITLFFMVGGAAATMMRMELLTPHGDVLDSPDAYNRLFTMHGVVMIFFFLIPSIPAVLGNFLLPMMLGAKDLAFPRLEPGELLRLCNRRYDRDLGFDLRRHRHRLDVLHAVQHDVLEHAGGPGGGGGVHRRVLVDHDGDQLHRHGSPDAGAGHDLDASAAVRLVASTPRA